jgi:hypothetical protein
VLVAALDAGMFVVAFRILTNAQVTYGYFTPVITTL